MKCDDKVIATLYLDKIINENPIDEVYYSIELKGWQGYSYITFKVFDGFTKDKCIVTDEGDLQMLFRSYNSHVFETDVVFKMLLERYNVCCIDDEIICEGKKDDCIEKMKRLIDEWRTEYGY